MSGGSRSGELFALKLLHLLIGVLINYFLLQKKKYKYRVFDILSILVLHIGDFSWLDAAEDILSERKYFKKNFFGGIRNFLHLFK